jgi:hypothetical protein
MIGFFGFSGLSVFGFSVVGLLDIFRKFIE